MKVLIVGAAALAAFVAVPASAQTAGFLTPGSGYSASYLFSSHPGYIVTGVAADPAGNVYFMESDPSFLNPTLSTRVYRQAAGGAMSLLFDFNSTLGPGFDKAAVSGTFLVWESGKLYFGESTFGTIRSLDLASSNASLVGTVNANYDLTFHGGEAFVSARQSSSAGNQIFKLDLSTGATDSLITTKLGSKSDFSGPIEFDSAGNLYYSATAFGVGSDLFGFTPAQLLTASGATPDLTLDNANYKLTLASQAYLASAGGASLFGHDFGTLRLVDTASQTSQPIATSSQSLGNLDVRNGNAFVAVTDYGTGRSEVYQVVPEPASALLIGFGAVGLLAFRRRRA